ncbi:hypothetical protein Q4463_00970 [Bacteroides caccae]|uniref:Transposase n=1 Tax=Bacteroides caccae TaxID=47678 RepID=A0AAW7WKY7_9BACE|nr:hypothetical protein [Bacteroides caccae]MDO6326330.1 hypothetical protein [Bacteroides caccae]MDO6339572.1 hypothetical protein [Bacteroides caccae]MDO6356443.1 hypothetical protein [Bacteroides caccae]
MAKRNSKTAAQQCRYYEVDNIFVYMVETYINGNFETFRRLYHELNKDARRDFMDFLLSEVEPGKSSVSCPLKPSDSAPLC